MGAKAAQSALDNSNTHIKEIDLLISVGASFDHIIPNQASVMKKSNKNAEQYNFPAIDINTTCLSFLTYQYAANVMNEHTKKVLIVSSEVSSKHLNEDN